MTDTETVGGSIDPVCLMPITPATAVTSAEHEGSTYYFCSEDCYTAFTADPATYV